MDFKSNLWKIFKVLFVITTLYIFLVLTPKLISGSTMNIITAIVMDVIWIFLSIYIYRK